MENRTCQNCKQNFTIEPDDFSFYEKMGVPAPNKCPYCRQQARTLYRNFKTLYKRTSSLSGKSIVSVYSPDAPFPVYESSEWWSDTWDALTYGRDIDWTRSFFEQFAELAQTVPRFALMNTKCTECEYSNMALSSNHCYLVFGAIENEDCAYGHIVWNCKDTFDGLYTFKCESCYECIDCLNSNKLLYSQECESCADSIGLFDCRSCTNCIGCVGLVGKSYYIFNQPVSHEEYKNFLTTHPINEQNSVEMILARRDKIRQQVPQRAFFGSHNNDVSGNHIYYAKNFHDSFDVKAGEDSRYCYTVHRAINSYDCSFMPDIEESYNVLTGSGSRIMCSHICFDCHDILYSDHCYGSNNLFGCFGLRQKSYCIFNKQYSKEDYDIIVPKLIEHMEKYGEWGEFFPKEYSPFAYNEAIVNEYMPLTKTEALEQGYRWRDDIPTTRGQGTTAHSALPKNPSDYSDALTKEILTCEKCQKNYKLVSDEISFYSRMGLAIPDHCFNCRHEARMLARNPRILWDTNCTYCKKEIKTSYPPPSQKMYKLYCEECYRREMI